MKMHMPLSATLRRAYRDPRELACCFDAADACTLRLLAACIVLFGRPRETVH